MRLLVAICLIAAVSARKLNGHDIPDYVSKMLLVGDWGSESRSGATRVANAMNEWAKNNGGVDIIVSLGDNFYPDGPESINSRLFDERWANTYTGSEIKDKVWFMAVGNHDYYPYEGYEMNEVLRSAKPDENRWYLPWLWHNTTFDSPGGTVNLVIADSQGARKNANDARSVQYPWWQETIESSTRLGHWIIPVIHHPCHTAGGHYPGSGTICNNFINVLKDNDAPFVLHGHDHNAQDLRFINGDSPDMLVIGGGGASRYSKDSSADKGLGDVGVRVNFFSSSYSFAALEMSSSGLTITMYDDSGRQLHAVSYSKNRFGKISRVE